MAPLTTLTPSIEEQKKEMKRQLAFGLITSTFAGTIFLVSPFVWMQLRSNLPFMATPRRKVDAALRYIIAQQKQTQTQTQQNNKALSRRLEFVDLGSGDGTAVLAAAATQHFRATGLELNPTLYLISELRRWTSPAPVRHNSNFKCRNFFHPQTHALLNRANVVMIFGVPSIMPQLSQTLKDQARPGTYVLSYRFRLAIQNPNESSKHVTQNGKADKRHTKEIISTEHDSFLLAQMVYDEEEMRIYKLLEQTTTEITKDETT
jgi:hypothetical protein